MGIKITLPTVEAVYELLRTTKPFAGWKLPSSGDIGFAIIRNRKDRGEFYVNNGVPYIGVSDVYHQTLDELMRTVAHEMCHLREQLHGTRKDIHHGAYFNKSADAVCKAHQFDRGAF